ncbi:unnamed protein product [Hymenolepis diminuta]|uniref:Uncharacterized protein n=1 Tax=Hymenolepis diminuta TaxID=6216 RepID=A0A564YU61_HYMDI|nr:unnamed protein product [Hymenolepis diminuta]
MLWPVLRLKVLSLKTRANPSEIFIEPLLLYGLSTIVYRKVGYNKLKAVQNTARQIMPGLYSERQMSV